MSVLTKNGQRAEPLRNCNNCDFAMEHEEFIYCVHHRRMTQRGAHCFDHANDAFGPNDPHSTYWVTPAMLLDKK